MFFEWKPGNKLYYVRHDSGEIMADYDTLVLHPKPPLYDVKLSVHFWVTQSRRKNGCMVSFLFHLTIKSVFEASNKCNYCFTFAFNGHSLPLSAFIFSVCLPLKNSKIRLTVRFLPEVVECDWMVGQHCPSSGISGHQRDVCVNWWRCLMIFCLLEDTINRTTRLLQQVYH